MKKNICLIYFDHMSGEFTSIYDIYLNLKSLEKYDFDLRIIAERNKNVINLERSLMDSTCAGIEFNNKEQKFEEYGTVICSAFYFFGLATNKIKNFFSCDKLIILDSSSFIMGEYNNINIFDEINKFPCINKYILGNDFNKKYFDKNIFHHYYHKLNFERINQYSENNKDELFTKKKNDVHPLEYNGYNYWRRINISFNPLKPVYYENIGKSIFEFLYLERPVYYSPKNKDFQEDGLTDYLSLFDIDDRKEQDLQISKKNINDQLGFKKSDLILELI